MIFINILLCEDAAAAFCQEEDFGIYRGELCTEELTHICQLVGWLGGWEVGRLEGW